MICELITNALRHGEPPLQVRLRVSTNALYLEIADQRSRRQATLARLTAALPSLGHKVPTGQEGAPT